MADVKATKILKDLTGQKFNRLSVISFSHRTRFGASMWACVCDCGNSTITCGTNIQNGNTKSCGCLRVEHRLTHGMTGTKEHRAWMAAKSRCFYEKRAKFKDYGGRGITMSEEWRHSFEAFLSDMGRCPPGHSLDRIDNDGNYCKENCRWATKAQQVRNTRRQFLFQGKLTSITELSESSGLAYATLIRRKRLGLPLLAPCRNKKLRPTLR